MDTYEGNTTQYDVGIIMLHIGISPSDIKGRLLDIGCGKGAKLVRHLKNLGKDAEGIDTELLIDEPFLMKADACHIPKPNNYYDFACTHMSHFKNGGEVFHYIVSNILSERVFQQIYAERKPPMVKTIDEAIRVIKPGCRFIIHPAPQYLAKDIQGYLRQKRVAIETQQITDSRAEAIIRQILSDEMIEQEIRTMGEPRLLGDKKLYDLMRDSQLHRLVLTKNSTG